VQSNSQRSPLSDATVTPRKIIPCEEAVCFVMTMISCVFPNDICCR
jgi:hypothetical protein